MKILPAILTDRREDLELKIRQSETFTDLVQIDIMDGQFVPSHSINAADLASVKTHLELEVHLMVKKPEDYIESFARAGASRIVFHYEAAPNPLVVINCIKANGKKAGIALNPETPLAALIQLVPRLDFALFLSVNPGYYGAPFIPEVLDKIRACRALKIPLELGTDGGINADTIVEAKQSGVDYVCVGSAIFRNDPAASYAKLRKLVE